MVRTSIPPCSARRPARFPHPRAPHGYRVPQVIADYATRFLAPAIAATRSSRTGGTLSVQHVDDIAPLVDGAVTLLPASLVKGLEYDHVIVVEPGDIVAAEPAVTAACTWCSRGPSPISLCCIASRCPWPPGRVQVISLSTGLGGAVCGSLDGYPVVAPPRRSSIPSIAP